MTPPPVAAISKTAQAAPSQPEGPLMPGVAWTTDARGNWGMTATELKPLTRLNRVELSASTSFNLDPANCAVSMVGSRLLPRDDDLFEANQLGTGAHAVLEHLMSLPPEERTKYMTDVIAQRFRSDRAFALTLLDENFVDQLHALSPEDLERWYGEIRRRAYGLWDIEDPQLVNVHANEMAFGERHSRTVKIGKVPFVGFIDRVDKILNLSTGEVEGYDVIDYKMGKYKDGGGKFGDDYGDQIRIYVVAVTEAEGITPTKGTLYFATYGKDRKVDISPAAVAKTVKRFEDAYDRMQKLAADNFYPTKAGPLCGWCELVNACPAAVAAGKTDLSDTEKDEKGRRYVVAGKEKKGLDPILLGIPTVGAPVRHETVPEAKSAAHIAVEQPAQAQKNITKPTVTTPTVTTQESNNMTTATPTAAPPVKVKESTGREATADGVLAGNSNSATAVWGLAGLAVEQLSNNNREVNGPSVMALANTYAHIVQAVQFGLSGTTSYQEGVNTRIRGALRTSVETLPAPWTGDAAAWDAYVVSLTNRTRAISNVAIKMFDAGANLPESPWRSLAAPAA